jgi:hypothetical protein
MGTGDRGRQAACDAVYRRFPHLAGARPTAACVGDRWIYTFDRSVPTAPGGPKIRQIVRVTVDAEGRVVKVVASR